VEDRIIPLGAAGAEAAPQAPLTFAAEPAAAEPADATRGLYFRFDVGVSQSTGRISRTRTSQAVELFAATLTAPYGEIEGRRCRAVLSGGIGYRFSPHVRGDLILGFRATCSMRRTHPSRPQIQGPVISSSAIACAYYDFATSGWSPYVGPASALQ